jgi:RNA polymerase sigma-70 factor (ECF subfamily)
MALAEKDLIQRVIATHDRRAFGELVRLHQSQLRYSLRQLTGWDEALADDLAQETFIRAWKSIGQFRGDARFFTWLYRIAYNCFAAHHRSRKPEESADEEFLEQHGGSTDHSVDLHRDFAIALAQFPPQQRMVLHLHMQREMTHEEIAGLLDCPLGTVKSHIQRGREKLQEKLSAWRTGENP